MSDTSQDPIIIVPYDSTWPQEFRELAEPMRKALGKTAIRIDHVGSTSVKGLDAKPVIDIQISVASFDPINAYWSPLASLGYVLRADNPDRTKRYFREAPNTQRTNIHVRQIGSFSQQFAILFRDYLRTHGKAAQAYAQVKHQLAETHRLDRQAYTEAKSDIIWDIMQRASEWSQRIAWQPQRSDV